MSTIRCFWSCADCKLSRQFVEISERDPDRIDIVRWLEDVAIPALVADHRSKSPLCQPREFSEVGISCPEGTDHIGAKVRS